MVQGEISIYRFTTGNELNEDAVTDKIEIEGNASTPDAKTKILRFNPTFDKRRTDVGNAFTNISNNPDTGPVPIQFELDVLFDERTGASLAIDKLRNWFVEDDGTVNEALPNGRLGFRNNKRSGLNLKPSATSGFKLVHFSINDQERFGGWTPGKIILEHMGDQSKFKTGG